MAHIPHIVDSVQCPRCNGESKVIDSRDGETARRRRRECLICQHRYSTYEIHADEYERIQKLQVDVVQVESVIAILNTIKIQFGDSNGHRQR